ncbi:MAG: alpha/beta hydrolase [Desulfarculaceae bacterium]|nr:alpha/beta hydrolase [Desulfarculaceae bacterium]
MPFAKANGIELYYETGGSGPRMLFIGGTAGDLRLKPGPLEWPWSDSFQVLAFDQRGQGQSAKPDDPYSMAMYAEDAFGLMEALEWGPCPVVGYSFGGMVAQELAIRHPERLSALVLCSTTSGGSGGSSYPLHEVFSLPLEQLVARMLEQTDRRHDKAWQEAHPEQWQELVKLTTGRMSLAVQDPAGALGLERQLEARKHHDTYQRLGGIELPTLVCGGRFDGVADPSAQQAMAEAIPGAKFMSFDGGHQFFLEDPTAFGAMVDFMKAAS